MNYLKVKGKKKDKEEREEKKITATTMTEQPMRSCICTSAPSFSLSLSPRGLLLAKGLKEKDMANSVKAWLL